MTIKDPAHREEVFTQFTVRPGDIVVTPAGQFHMVGELFDQRVEVKTVFKYGSATLQSFRSFSYEEVEAMKVASTIPSDHPAKANFGKDHHRMWISYEAQVNLYAGVLTPKAA